MKPIYEQTNVYLTQRMKQTFTNTERHSTRSRPTVGRSTNVREGQTNLCPPRVSLHIKEAQTFN